MLVHWFMKRLCNHYEDLIEPAYRSGDKWKAYYYTYKWKTLLDDLMAGKYDGI